jgi:glycosyltransferase involved in cell wall biosynthesis
MVLHLSTFHLEGGAGVAATRLHRALLKSGSESDMLVPMSSSAEHRVHMLARDNFQTKKAWGRFVGERLAFLPFEKDKSVRFAFSPAAIGTDISLHPLVKSADIIHLHWINFGFLSLKSLRSLFALGKPVVWTLHDMWTFTGGCHYTRGCDHYLNHCGYCPFLSRPDRYDISFTQFSQKAELYQLTNMALVSPSNWLHNLVGQAPLTQDLRALNIPNCIDTGIFRPIEKQQARERLRLPKDKRLVLFAGANTQDPRKGFRFFKEAIGLLKRDDVEVLIFGKSKADSFVDFPTKVHYLGKLVGEDEMVSAYNAADLIVVPSLEDNLPNTIMEAMACGTPAVGFATGGIPEMIDHLKNGFVASPKSARSISEGIQLALENHTVFSANARQKALECYSERIIADRYRDLYQSLLHG